MNGYHQQQPYEGYSQPPPHHPSQIPRNMIAATKPQHPYSSYYNGGDEYAMYAAGGSPLRQGPPPELNHYMQGQPPRTQMNPNAAVFMPRQYEMPANVSRAPPQQGFNPFGYNNHRHYTPQRIPPPTMQHPQQQPPQSLQYQQQPPPQAVGGYGSSGSSFSTLRMSLAEQKQQSEEQLKRQQRDQEEYASRFLAAVQERVQRPSSASAAQGNHQQQSSNNGQQSMNGTSLQNLAMMLQQEGLSSAANGYFDQDINSYDFEAQHNANPPFQLSQELMDKIASLPNKLSLYEVQIGLEQILAEPTEFDAWIVAVRDRLASKEITSDDLEAAAWLAIEIAIYSEDSQYVFARVCTYLYERLSSFKEPLLKMIREFHELHTGYPIDISQNLLVFMAELYVQAFAPVGVRNHPIPTSLYEEFSTVLKAEPMDDALVKKVVSTLKLCGRHLEMDIGEKCMGELIKKLEDFTKEGTRPKGLTDSGASHITNLMIYRSAGWGGNETSTTSASSAPIRFAPDNNMDLTEEEIKFLESNGAIEGGSSYSSGPSSNDIYDAEILEDYEKFLRDHAEATAISAAEKALERLSMEEEDDYCYDNQDPPRDDNSTPTPHSKQ